MLCSLQNFSAHVSLDFIIQTQPQKTEKKLGVGVRGSNNNNHEKGSAEFFSHNLDEISGLSQANLITSECTM